MRLSCDMNLYEENGIIKYFSNKLDSALQGDSDLDDFQGFLKCHRDEFGGPLTIYIRTTSVGLIANALGQIPYPFILVSGDADETAPTQIFANDEMTHAFIESPKIIHWFAQNGVLNHPKFSQIPIGLDYHTMSYGETLLGPKILPYEQEQILIATSQSAPPLSRRLLKAHINFNFIPAMTVKYGITPDYLMERLRVIQMMPSILVDCETQRVDRKTTWEIQSKYAFVISPHGNGLDCHRTWEALCLGCIPIVRTSPLDGLYEGLPVYIVQDWSEVTEGNLKKVLADFSKRTFDLNRLTLSYWMNQINAKKTPVS